MKKILLAFSMIIGLSHAHAQSAEVSAKILDLTHNNSFPVAQAVVTYQPQCGDQFLRIEQSTPKWSEVEGANKVYVRVVVLRNFGIRCMMRPSPRIKKFTVHTMTGPLVLAPYDSEGKLAIDGLECQSLDDSPIPLHKVIVKKLADGKYVILRKVALDFQRSLSLYWHIAERKISIEGSVVLKFANGYLEIFQNTKNVKALLVIGDQTFATELVCK